MSPFLSCIRVDGFSLPLGPCRLILVFEDFVAELFGFPVANFVFGSVLRDYLFIVSQQMIPMSSDDLEELYGASRCYFGLLVWAQKFLEGASIFSKSPIIFYCREHYYAIRFLIPVLLGHFS